MESTVRCTFQSSITEALLKVIKKHRKFVIAFFLLLACCIQTAQAKPTSVLTDSKTPKSPWYGSQIKLGFNFTTGNTTTDEFNSALGLEYAKNRWENTFKFSGAYSKSNDVLNKQRYVVRDQVKYGFNATRRHFLFMRGGWIDDRFSPYSYQSTIAVGYGRDLIDTPDVLVSLQAGPGYRNDKVRGSGEVEERFIGTATLNAKINVSKTGYIKETFQYDSGPPFNYIDSTTSFTTDFMTHWSLQAAYEMEYYSRIPPRSTHTEKLDTTTTLALVYNF